MRESHIRLLKRVLLALSVLTFTIAASAEYILAISNLPTTDAATVRSLVQVALALTGSFLVTATIPILVHHYREHESKSRSGKFNAFFSLSPGQRPVVVLPQFKVGTVSPTESYRGLNGISLKDLGQLGKFCLSFDDTIALRHITTLFAENGAPPPKILFDEDVWKYTQGRASNRDKGFEEINEARSFILVGLLSNSVVASIAARSSAGDLRSFKLTDHATDSQANYRLEIAPLHVRDLDKWRFSKSFAPTNEINTESYALIARVKLDEFRTAIVVGGQNARATRKIASYLRENWQSIHEFKEIDRESAVGTHPFSMSFSVPPQDAADDNEEAATPRKLATYYTDSTGKPSNKLPRAA